MKKIVLLFTAFSILCTLFTPVFASSSENITTELIDPEIEAVSIEFLDIYLRSVFLYEDNDYEDFTISSLSETLLSSEITYESVEVSIDSFLDNISFIDSKVEYWQHVRTSYEIYRKDFNVEYNITDYSISGNIANVTISAAISYQYIDCDSPTFEELIFQIDLLKIDNQWLVCDVTELYSWLDNVYKDDATFDVDVLISEFDLAFEEMNRAEQSVTVYEQSQPDLTVSPASSNVIYYNSTNATAYAYTYTTSVDSNTASAFHNKNFYDWSAYGDCINFVSQCFWAGLGGNNCSNSINNSDIPMDTQGSYTWYSTSSSNSSSSWRGNSAFEEYANNSNNATSEVGLHTNYYYISTNSSFSSITNYSTVLLGALLQVVDSQGDNFGHAIIVTDVEGSSRSDVYYCAHTNMAKHKRLTDGGYDSCPIKVFKPTFFYTGSTSTSPRVSVTMYRPVSTGTQLTLTASTDSTCYKITTTVYSPGQTASSSSASNTASNSMSYTFSETGLYTIRVTVLETSSSTAYYYYYTIRTY